MIRLRLNNEIYSSQNVSLAKEAYSMIADIYVSDGRKTTELVFSNCKYDEERTVKEFENYIIGLENL